MKKLQLKQMISQEIKNVINEDVNNAVRKDYSIYSSKKKAFFSAFKEYRKEIAKLGDAHLGDLEELYDNFIDLDNEVNDLIKTYGYGK